MTPDFANIRTLLEQLTTAGQDHFDDIEDLELDEGDIFRSPEADHYWSQLDETLQEVSIQLQTDLMQVTKAIANCIKQSTLLSEADRRDLGTWTKSIRASLRLRRYQAWDAELLHDEGTVLGIQTAGQSDSDPILPKQARRNFQRDISSLFGLVDLLDFTPILSPDDLRVNPQATAQYETDTAFVMMQIDPQQPKLEDLRNL